MELIISEKPFQAFPIGHIHQVLSRSSLAQSHPVAWLWFQAVKRQDSNCNPKGDHADHLVGVVLLRWLLKYPIYHF
jgi:hypothetical protein